MPTTPAKQKNHNRVSHSISVFYTCFKKNTPEQRETIPVISVSSVDRDPTREATSVQ